MKGYGDLPKVTQLTSVRGQRVGPSPGSLAAEHRPLNLLTKKGLYDNTLGPAVLTSGMLQAGEDMEAVSGLGGKRALTSISRKRQRQDGTEV